LIVYKESLYVTTISAKSLRIIYQKCTFRAKCKNVKKSKNRSLKEKAIKIVKRYYKDSQM